MICKFLGFIVTQTIFVEFQIGLDWLHNAIHILSDSLACSAKQEKDVSLTAAKIFTVS